jgi:GH15 family glucan-1,4-alpha-glucosidase
MGHQAEARAGIAAYFAAQPVGRMQKDVGGPYQISVVRYFGDGSEEPFFTQEGANNIEFDNWGLVLWVLGEYVETFHDDQLLAERTYRGTIYDSAKQFIVKPLLANLESHHGGSIVAADTSIWEERQKDKKHFAFSTLMAIVGLRRFDALAALHKDRDLHAELARVLPRLDAGFAAAFVRGSIHGTLEPGIKNDIDGAVLSAINLGVVTDPAVIHKTVDQMARLAVASGGYRRVVSVIEDPKIYEYWYERQEFVFVDLSLAEVYLRMKQPEKAAALVRTVVAKAAKDHDFVPEMYVSVVNPLFKGAIGEPTGAIPMVGYGAGAYISYLIVRQTLR